MAVGELFVIIISSMLVSNVVLSQFLGICPFLGVSKKVETAVGMGAAVTFVITIASAITYPIYYFILEPTGLAYLETIAFMPALHASLGVYLPLITTNCAVLGVALNNVTDYAGESFGIGFLYSVVRGLFTALGFLVAITIMASIRERNEHNDVPKSFQGTPIVLVTASLMAIAFCGFAGLV